MFVNPKRLKENMSIDGFMKALKVSALLICVFALLSVSKVKLNRDLDIYQLKGKVKSVQEMQQSMDSTKGAPSVYVFGKVVRNFNEQGNITEILTYNQHDTLMRRLANIYTKNNRKRVTWVFNYYTAKVKKRKQEARLYDKNGKLNRLIYFNPNGQKSSIAEYDGLGNRCNVTLLARKAGLTQRIEINYNYNYDSLVRITQEYAINEDGSMLNKYVHKYDKKGNETETDVYNTDSTISRVVSSQFDSRGNAVDVHDAYFFTGGDLGQKRIAIYDDKGFKIEEDTYQVKPDNSLFLVKSVQYENDKMGNWVKETSFFNNRKGNVTTRVIEYY